MWDLFKQLPTGPYKPSLKLVSLLSHHALLSVVYSGDTQNKSALLNQWLKDGFTVKSTHLSQGILSCFECEN